jgi:hypothetical protein
MLSTIGYSRSPFMVGLRSSSGIALRQPSYQPWRRILQLQQSRRGPRYHHDIYPGRGTAVRVPGIHPRYKTYSQLWDARDNSWANYGTEQFLEALRSHTGVENPQLPEAEPLKRIVNGQRSNSEKKGNRSAGHTSDCADWKKNEGPKMWGRIHRTAMAATSVDEFSAYLDNETAQIKCDECKTHFAKERTDNQLPRDPAKLFEWVYDRHVTVRVKQKKGVWPIEKARQYWSNSK